MTFTTPERGDDSEPHRPADDVEELYFQGSPLLRGDVKPVAAGVGLVVLLIVGIVLYHRLEGKLPPLLIVFGVFAVAELLVMATLLRTKTVTYRISNYRVDVSRGMLSRNTDTLELWHVEDIRLHQSLLGRILGVGDITIFSHDDTTPTLLLQGIPDPRKLFTVLEQRIIAVKRQRGVIKTDAGQ